MPTVKRALMLILLAHVALGVYYSFATPIFEASDEYLHYPVVREIAENRRLPVQDPAVETLWEQEGSQPPLYYALGALLTGWIDTADFVENAVRNPFVKAGRPGTTDNVNLMAHPPGQSPLQGRTVAAVYVIRWLSVLMGTATVYFTYRLSRAVAPGRQAVALLAAALTAFNPMVLFINASVNNDNLTMLLSTVALWLLVSEVQSDAPGYRWRQTILLGAILGLAALTKLSGLVLLPAAALALTLTAVRTGQWRVWVARGLTLLILTALIAGWWYLRNFRLYGDVTGLERMVAIAGARPPGFGLLELSREWTGFWYSYWGVFGAFNVLAPRWFYLIAGTLTLAAAGGLLLAFVRSLKRGNWPPANWRGHLILIVFLSTSAVSLVRWTLQTLASQGRLLFGGVAVISLYMALGLLAWFPARRRAAAAAGLSVALALAAFVIPLISIIPAYRPPASAADLPEDAIRLDAVCDNGLTLLGYRLDADSVLAGEPLGVTLYWTAAVRPDRNYQLALNGYGYREENVAKLDTWPGGGLLPTAFWRPGVVMPDHYLLKTDAESDTPTIVRLGVRWHADLMNAARDEEILCYAGGRSFDTIFLDAGALVRPLPEATAEPPAPKATLQHGILFLGSSVSRRGDDVIAELTWQATEAIPGDYTVFVHLFDEAGNKVAQGDAPPRAGYWPTSRWRPGESVSSSHVVELPSELPAGRYRLGIGLYDPTDGERLAAYDAQGSEWRDRIILLEPALESP